MQENTSPAKIKKWMSISNVAFLLVVTALIGQLLGLLRTKLVNANFEATGPGSTDAYFAAFTIPDFFFYTLAAGVLGVAFIPVLADRLQKGERKAVWELSSSLLNLLSIVMLVVAAVIFIFAEPLMQMVSGHRFTAEQLDNAVTIMRFLSLNPLFFTISGLLSSVQQTLGRFFFFAIAPLFYNLSIIVSIYIFQGTEVGIKGLGIGAFVGGLLQLAVVCIGLAGTKFRWHPKILWRKSDFKTVMHQLPPRALDQGVDQVQTIIETNFARRLGEGNISYYNNAYILQSAPILLIGSAIGTATFPRLAQRLSQGRSDLFRSDFLKILRFTMWITVPVVIVAFFARGYLARLIFTKDAPEIALIFGFLTAAIFFRIIYAIISRWFYAQKDTKTPLVVSLFTIVISFVLTMMWARTDSYGIAGLALAVSAAAFFEVTVLWAIMLIRDHGLFNKEFWLACWRIVSVSGFTLFAGYLIVQFFPLESADTGVITLGSKLAIIAGTILVTHIGISGLFGLVESRPVFNWLKRIILWPVIKRPFSGS
ncbi:MAG TPA: lipid II flippase MurJ [Candidatus Saccharimonadales bacterium]|nr:lipid II flippase MurJ [Candidatus Saccharimonadales bacterium]